MEIDSDVKLTIHFNDPALQPEEQDEQAQRLIAELKEMDEIDFVDRVLDPNPPEGHRSLGGFLAGFLKVGMNADNVKKVLGFLGGFLKGKSIEITIEVEKDSKNNRERKKLTVKANSQEELEAAVKAAQDFSAN